jgi:superfamily I DNA/RNA helicase/RecB family exonuclease
MLTEAQRRVVDHDGGPARVQGPAGSGKTTSLRHRFLRLAGRHGAGRVWVVARNRLAAGRFLEAVLPGLAGGFDALPVITFPGLAFAVLRRHGWERRLLGPGQQWAVVRDMLTAEARAGPASLWPTLGPWLGRPAFVDEVAAAVLALESSLVAGDDVVARAAATGLADRWAELVAFNARYQAALAQRGLVDAAGLLVAAVRLLTDEPGSAAAERARFDAILVDDFEAATVATNRLLNLLLGAGDPEPPVTVAGNADAAVGAEQGHSPAHLLSFQPALDVHLDQSFRRPRAGPRLVLCRHPSIEPEAVAGELVRAHQSGVGWDQMAVLVRRPTSGGSGGRGRGRAIARALARHGIPVAWWPAPLAGEPAVRGIVDVLRWVEGDAAALGRLLATPVAGLDPAEVRAIRRQARADGRPLEAHPRLASLVALRDDLVARARGDPWALAHEVFRRTLAHLVPDPERGPPDIADERALDAVVAFLDGLSAFVQHQPGARLADYLGALEGPDVGPGPAAARGSPEGVTIAAIDAAAGREWHTVVIAGCLEGELPHVRGHVGFFDRALLDGPAGPTGPVGPGAPLERPFERPSVAERRRRSLAEERRRFGLAVSRATGEVVATAAPEPGTPVSRFVDGRWPVGPPQLPPAPGRRPVARALTTGVAPVWPDGTLHLSASQLDTYADCPLRYAYTYALRVKREGGVQADLGSMVHAVLQAFLDPADPDHADRSRERLLDIAQAHWRNDVARYRPQVEEARRDFYDMLDRWWEHEIAPELGRLEVLRVEHRFDVEVGGHRVHGAIDRVDRADDGVGLRVVDYKTGRTEPRADEMADDLQLATYHLAATLDPELAALGPPSQLRLLFLRSMKAHEQPVTSDHAAVTRARITAAAQAILDERFEPSVDAQCRYCDFQRLCPLWPEGREVGVG